MSTFEALNKLAKWRAVFASWQLGTRLLSDGETRAVKDHREVTILLRAELNAMLGLLIQKGIFTAEEFDASLHNEAHLLDKDYEEKFPGFSTSQEGVHMNAPVALETMRKMGLPE